MSERAWGTVREDYRRNGPDVESAAAVVDQETLSRLLALGYIN